MPASKTSSLSSFFGSAIKANIKPNRKPKLKAKAKAKATSTVGASTAAVEDSTLKIFVSALNASEEQTVSTLSRVLTTNTNNKAYKSSPKLPKPSSSSLSSSSLAEKSREESVSESVRFSSNLDSALSSVDSPGLDVRGCWVLQRISSILITADDEEDDFVEADDSFERELCIPWFPSLAPSGISLHRKEVTRERKHKWFFKSTQVNRFNRLVNMCADKVGPGTAFGVFGKLGRETSVKEYNALLKVCIEMARSAEDEDAALEQIHRAYVFFKSMKEHGFQLEDETFGPFLVFLIEMDMVQEFFFFLGVIKDANPNAVSKLGYYEMLMWIKVDDEEKIQELINYIVTEEGESNSSLQENYLLALCEGGREKELLKLYEIIDITKMSVNCAAAIFKSLGKVQLDAFVEKFLNAFKARDFGAENFSNFLSSYAIGNPNLAVEDVFSTFKNLHEKFEVAPSSAAYENLIKYCCTLLKVHDALDLVDEVFKGGLTVSIEAINHILHACEESCDYNLVHRVYSLICDRKLKPKAKTFRLMINLCMRMKDVAAAYSILSDLEKMNVTPTANMYNSIMAGYFREVVLLIFLRCLCCILCAYACKK